MQPDKKKGYRRYTVRSIHECHNPHEGDAFEPSLVYALASLGFKERVTFIRGLIADAVTRDGFGNGDGYAARLIPVFVGALADLGHSEILEPVAGEQGAYQYEDVEYLGYHPFSGLHALVPTELMALYLSFQAQISRHYDDPRKVAMPETKKKIMGKMCQCVGTNAFSVEDLLKFILKLSENKEVLGGEKEMWKTQLRNVTDKVSEGLLLHHAQMVAKWPVFTSFRKELLEFIVIARVKALDWQGLSTLVLPSVPKANA